MTHHVDITDTATIAVAAVRFHVGSDEMPGIGAQMNSAFGTVAAGLGRAGLVPAGPAVASYAPATDGFDVTAGFQVPSHVAVPAGLERVELGGVEAAHTTHLGAYDDLPSAYSDLEVEARAAGRQLQEGVPMWEEYWSEPGTPESETRTEIYWPLV